jgi:hypothetical protein
MPAASSGAGDDTVRSGEQVRAPELRLLDPVVRSDRAAVHGLLHPDFLVDDLARSGIDCRSATSQMLLLDGGLRSLRLAHDFDVDVACAQHPKRRPRPQ